MAAIAAPIIGGLVSAFTGGCGPSAEEKQQLATQNAMESDLMNAFNSRLGEQRETITSLNTALSNVAAGKFPPGMDPATFATLQSRALTTTSNAYRNAAQAAGAAISSRGGGTADPSGILSGPEVQVFGEIAAKGAAKESDLLQQLQIEDWQAGREDYLGYVKGLEAMAELQDPAKLAGAMTESTKSPTQLSQEITQQRSQMASDIGIAATNVAAGLGTMIKQQKISEEGLIGGPISTDISRRGGAPQLIMTPPGTAPVPGSDEYANIG